ncbi:MAG: hypothetical protein HOW73_26250 [Polyangiaceae bacterium]|nr:hypothetical protein [Polyangiaceae bacterium]
MFDLGPATVRFCEERLPGLVAEPANTWSSLGYVIVGVWLFAKRGAARRWPLAIVATAEIGIGLGSMALHGTGTFAGEVLDLTGMFLLSGCIFALGLGRLLNFDDRRILRVWIAAVALPLLALAVIPPSGIASFATILIAGIACELLLRQRGRSPSFALFGQALAILAVAFAFWVGDITKLVCSPQNHILGGHAVWHLLNAVSIKRLFDFYARALGR